MTTYPQRKRLHHTPPPWVRTVEVFFITICCAQRGLNSLAREEVFAVIAGAAEYYVNAGKLSVHLLLGMPNHLHALLAVPPAHRMDGVLRDWKRYVAKQAGIAWQDGFFDHRLRSTESFEEKAHYIRMNPVRAGLVPSPDDWPYVWPK